MKLIVVSICKNEAEMIGKVLDGIPAKIPGITKIEKWVIDDGSSDDTIAIAKKHGAYVRSDGVQKRLAFRFREVIDLALSRGVDILVNIDGDMQFNPKEIPLLVQPIVSGEADFVAANRFEDPKTGKIRRPANMPPAKYYGNKVGARIVSKLSGRNFRDVTCGFRAYNREALMVLNINSGYTYTQESFQVLAMKKVRIASVPVSIKYYPGRDSRVVLGFYQFLFGSAMNILRAYRDYAPLSFFGTLGFIFVIPGILLAGFDGVHWLVTGLFSPYKAFGLVGMYLMTLGFFLWGLGLVADMLDRMLSNQEKILEQIKRIRYDDDRQK